MTALDDALNEIIFSGFVDYFSPEAKRKLVIVDFHFESAHEEELGRFFNISGQTIKNTRFKDHTGGIIWRYYKTHKRFIWGSLKVPVIKTEHWTFFINSAGWGVAIKRFYLGDPDLFQNIEKWFTEFAAKKPGKRWRERQ